MIQIPYLKFRYEICPLIYMITEISDQQKMNRKIIMSTSSKLIKLTSVAVKVASLMEPVSLVVIIHKKVVKECG